MVSKANKIKQHKLTLQKVEDNPELLEFLSLAIDAPSRTRFISKAAAETDDRFWSSEKDEKKVFDKFFRCLNRYTTGFPNVEAAAHARKSLSSLRREDKREFMKGIGLTMSPEERDTFLQSMKVYRVKRLSKEKVYPPVGHWVVESESIEKKWRKHLEKGKQPDCRLPRKPLHILKPEHLQLDIPPNQNAFIVDADTGELVMVVIRKFCGNKKLLEHLHKVIKKVVTTRRSVRLEDPGKYCLTGYSAGSRSAPTFHWVRNLLSRRWSEDKIDTMNREIAHAYSLSWMLFKKRFPPEAVNGLEAWLESTGVPRMNTDILEGLVGKGDIDLDIGPYVFTISNAEGAPPSGGAAVNYARPIHHEHQPHKFAFAWTVRRTLGNRQGGHFYNSDYGIRIQASQDSAFAWPPSDWHGTSLQDYPPTTQDLPDLVQTGLAITTSARMAKVWARYQEGMVSHKQVEEELEEHHEELYDFDPEVSSFYVAHRLPANEAEQSDSMGSVFVQGSQGLVRRSTRVNATARTRTN